MQVGIPKPRCIFQHQHRIQKCHPVNATTSCLTGWATSACPLHRTTARISETASGTSRSFTLAPTYISSSMSSTCETAPAFRCTMATMTGHPAWASSAAVTTFPCLYHCGHQAGACWSNSMLQCFSPASAVRIWCLKQHITLKVSWVDHF